MSDLVKRLQRYEPMTDEGNVEGYGKMEPDAQGEWVRHSEAAAEIERLTALLQSSREMLHEAAVEFDAIHPGAGIAETIRSQIARIKEPRNDQ